MGGVPLAGTGPAGAFANGQLTDFIGCSNFFGQTQALILFKEEMHREYDIRFECREGKTNEGPPARRIRRDGAAAAGAAGNCA